MVREHVALSISVKTAIQHPCVGQQSYDDMTVVVPNAYAEIDENIVRWMVRTFPGIVQDEIKRQEYDIDDAIIRWVVGLYPRRLQHYIHRQSMRQRDEALRRQRQAVARRRTQREAKQQEEKQKEEALKQQEVAARERRHELNEKQRVQLTKMRSRWLKERAALDEAEQENMRMQKLLIESKNGLKKQTDITNVIEQRLKEESSRVRDMQERERAAQVTIERMGAERAQIADVVEKQEKKLQHQQEQVELLTTNLRQARLLTQQQQMSRQPRSVALATAVAAEADDTSAEDEAAKEAQQAEEAAAAAAAAAEEAAARRAAEDAEVAAAAAAEEEQKADYLKMDYDGEMSVSPQNKSESESESEPVATESTSDLAAEPEPQAEALKEAEPEPAAEPEPEPPAEPGAVAEPAEAEPEATKLAAESESATSEAEPSATSAAETVAEDAVAGDADDEKSATAASESESALASTSNDVDVAVAAVEETAVELTPEEEAALAESEPEATAPTPAIVRQGSTDDDNTVDTTTPPVLVLSISCANLPKGDTFSKSDPITAVYQKQSGQPSYSLVSTTEHQTNEHDPVFATPVTVTASPDSELKIVVYDTDDNGTMDEKDRLGYCTVTAAQLTQMRDAGSAGEIVAPLLDKNDAQANKGTSTLRLTCTVADSAAAVAETAATNATVANVATTEDPLAAAAAKEAAAAAEAAAAEAEAAAAEAEAAAAEAEAAAAEAEAAAAEAEAEAAAKAAEEAAAAEAEKIAAAKLAAEKQAEVEATAAAASAQAAQDAASATSAEADAVAATTAEAEAASAVEMAAKATKEAEEAAAAAAAAAAPATRAAVQQQTTPTPREETVTLTLSCKDLPKNDVLSKSDPVGAVYVRNAEGTFSLAGTTETFQNEHNPVFTQPITFSYTPGNDVDLQVIIYDTDGDGQMDASHRLGAGAFSTSHLSLPTGGTFQIVLVDKDGKPANKGKAMVLVTASTTSDASRAAAEFIKAEQAAAAAKTQTDIEKSAKAAADKAAAAPTAESSSEVVSSSTPVPTTGVVDIKMNISCTRLPRKNRHAAGVTEALSDPLVAIYCASDDGNYMLVGQTEALKAESAPKFAQSIDWVCDMSKFADAEMKAIVYDVDDLSNIQIEHACGSAVFSSKTFFDNVDMTVGAQQASASAPVTWTGAISYALLDDAGAASTGQNADDTAPAASMISFEYTVATRGGDSPAEALSSAMTAHNAEETVTLTLSCKDLPKNDVLSKSDPVGAVYVRNAEGTFSLAGTTETFQNEHNPVFTQPITFTYKPAVGVDIKVIIYDTDGDGQMDASHRLGAGAFSTSHLSLPTGGTFQVELTDKNGDVANKGKAQLLVTASSTPTAAATAAAAVAMDEL